MIASLARTEHPETSGKGAAAAAPLCFSVTSLCESLACDSLEKGDEMRYSRNESISIVSDLLDEASNYYIKTIIDINVYFSLFSGAFRFVINPSRNGFINLKADFDKSFSDFGYMNLLGKEEEMFIAKMYFLLDEEINPKLNEKIISDAAYYSQYKLAILELVLDVCEYHLANFNLGDQGLADIRMDLTDALIFGNQLPD
jgi:hypothetical protein